MSSRVAGAVAAFEHNADLQSFVHDPPLELDQLDMQPQHKIARLLRKQ